MLTLAWPWMLAALPAPLLARWLLPAAPQRAGGVLFLPFAAALTAEKADRHRRRGWWRSGLWWGGMFCWLLLLLAAARPQWLGDPVPLPQIGRNLLLAIDVSGSMETRDLDRRGLTRLQVVKAVAGDFIARRAGDRIGLILFGAQAYLMTPLTFDRTTVATLLQEALVGIAGRETAIGDAIGLAVKKLQDIEGEAVLILLTDGANTAGTIKPLHAAEMAAKHGLRIHTIGVGGKPRMVIGLMGRHRVNPGLALDEKSLKAIAETTGGRYFRASDREILEDIYRRLDRLEPIEEDDRMVRPVDDLYPWPLGLALCLSFLMALSLAKPGAKPAAKPAAKPGPNHPVSAGGRPAGLRPVRASVSGFHDSQSGSPS